MEQSEVNQIIVDSMEPDVGTKFEKLDKEFMILKGSIKKLILDIREQMNNTDNPFSNIQMLQMPPPAPVIKEDPVELDVPKKEDKQADKDAAAKAEAAKQAEEKAAREQAAREQAIREQVIREQVAREHAAKEKTMAHETRPGTVSTCPLAAKANAPHNQCPLSATGSAFEQTCPAARANNAPYAGCQTNHHNYPFTYHTPYHQPPEGSPCRNPGRETANGWGAPYAGYPPHFGEGHICPGCGMPLNPYSGMYPGYWPLPYPPEHRETRYGPAGYEAPWDASASPAYPPRPYYYDHPEYEPAHYGHPYWRASESDYGYDLPGSLQERSRRAPPARRSREYYYPDSDDYLEDYERPLPVRRQRADEEYWAEPGRYRQAPRRKRVARAPEAPVEYYEPEPVERLEPASYRPAPRGRRAPYTQAPGYEPEEDYEITEPLPEIDSLPDQPEPEPDLIRVRKRSRISRIVPEPVVRDMVVEQPNPKPRRSRSAKLRG